MIIDTSNAPCGPGFLPGLRLSEGRFDINRRRSRPPRLGLSQALVAFVPLSADHGMPGAVRGSGVFPFHYLPFGALPPLFPPFPSGKGRPSGPHESGAAAGGPLVLRADRATRAQAFDGAALAGDWGWVATGVWVGWGASALPAAGYPTTSSPVSLPIRGEPRPWLRPLLIRLRPQIRRDNPLNLSILLSGGKETNQDSLSSGERRGKSPAPNPRPTGGRGKCGVRKTACPVSLGGLSPSDRGSAHGRCEAGNGPRRAGVRSSRSRVVWECSPKWVVNSI